MNRVQVRKKKGKDSTKTIGLIIPTTTRTSSDPGGVGGSKISKLDDLIFFRILLPSFLKYASNTHYYNFFLGYDHDDPFYSKEKNREEIRKRFEQVCPKIYTLTFLEFGQEVEKGDLSTMWSLLANEAVKTNEYLYQLGDDIEFKSKGWEDLFIALLGKVNNIGAVGPKDEQNGSGILTQSFVHCTHLSIFKRYFPKELKNWYIDDWISEVYDIRVERRVIVHNRGGKERYEIEDIKEVKDKVVRRDRELIQKISECEVMRFRCDNNFIYLEQDRITICGTTFSEYDFICDRELDSRMIKKINRHLNKPEVSFYIDKNLYHRYGNHIIFKDGDVTTVQNVENVKLDRCDDDIYLFQQFYISKDEERYQETRECLKRNVELGLFKKIYLINERIYTDKELGIKSDLISQFVIDKRLTYSVFLHHASRVDGFCVLSNSDIFFDQTLDNTRKSVLREIKSVQCLRRYEYRGEQDLNDCEIYCNYQSSQDTWILHSSKILVDNIGSFDIEIGVKGCDNKISDIFRVNGFTLLNNFEFIRTYHNHKSDLRSYKNKQLPGSSTFILGSNIFQSFDSYLKNYNLFWQYPVITEKTFYEQNKNDKYFIGLPWATLIDKRLSYIMNIIEKQIYIRNSYTCCQHIRFRNLIPLFKSIGITTLYTPHKTNDEDMIEGIKIKTCPLYAKVIEEDPDLFSNPMSWERKYLYSFQGGHQLGYMSNIRLLIFEMNHPENCYIKNTGEWHFNQIVYNTKQNKAGEYNGDKTHFEKETEYKQLLKNSRFTLCPSGTGPNSIRFWEALGSGSIPVVLSDKMSLPEHDLWEKAILIIEEKNISRLSDIVSQIDHEKEIKMRDNCLKLYNFFKDNYKNEHK